MNPVWSSPVVIGGFITLALAIIAGLQLLLVTSQTARLQGAAELRAAAIRAKEKAEDYARQDEVARRAEEVSRRQAVAAENVARVAIDAQATAKLLLASQTATAARQDEVAARVELAAKQAADAAELLRAAQAESIQRTDEVARLASASDLRVQAALIEIGAQGKLSADQIAKIHTLVNSDMTAARTAERDAMNLLVVALRLVIAANRKMGIAIEPALIDQVDAAERRVGELNKILAERVEAQQKIDALEAANARNLGRRSADAAAATRLAEIAENTAATARNTERVIGQVVDAVQAVQAQQAAAKTGDGTAAPEKEPQ